MEFEDIRMAADSNVGKSDFLNVWSFEKLIKKLGEGIRVLVSLLKEFSSFWQFESTGVIEFCR